MLLSPILSIFDSATAGCRTAHSEGSHRFGCRIGLAPPIHTMRSQSHVDDLIFYVLTAIISDMTRVCMGATTPQLAINSPITPLRDTDE